MTRISIYPCCSTWNTAIPWFGVWKASSSSIAAMSSTIIADTAVSELKGTAGFGVRFMTPVGPIGVDYGYNVMRTEDDDPRERWSFVIGHAF